MDGKGNFNLKTVVTYVTELLVQHGLDDSNKVQYVDGVWIYPKDYFCPKDYLTGKLIITDKTVSIHHYGETWQPWEHKMEMKIWRMLGIKKHPLITWHIDHWLEMIGIKR